MSLLRLYFGIIFFLFGITIGSFLNVLIYRIPKKEDFVKTRSHCMNCGYQLEWYDLVPLFSWIFLGGRCRKCRTRISVQYPLIELLNGIMYLVTFVLFGLDITTLLYCGLFSALIALSVIDFRTYEIPVGFNVFILLLGIIRVVTDLNNWSEYVIGLVAVSVPLLLIFYATKGRGIGGGDVKLMGAVGLLIGWKLVVLAFFLGCLLGSVIHIARMKISGESHVLAMGPYLSAGIVIAVFAGERMIAAYIGYLNSLLIG
jgi:leader peptidase (prepilin peptidase)/N-methyltransferase